ncbi:hypothetical protein TSOC_010317 [Tetrabaena socialis]|uniref:FAD dependent oxidoreductase domain-containing protein n=1 Tax=Tetrabaena socialis TaxID=47790 RepID=A0A2J7ZTP8_9CHLO|nr:hypothetical protein TSOC_010317 [Tetrabaena socialis]|eukprot:PNH03610.1 hypothetical protein TSOC_010317 [Tetrabaena socialis]
MGGPTTTAQVHPALLTRALIAAAVARGAVLVRGCAEGLRVEGGGQERRVTGVLVDGSVLPADAAVVAMGPWSDALRGWLAAAGLPASCAPRISGQKYHSVVLRPHAPVTNHMLFTGFNGGVETATPSLGSSAHTGSASSRRANNTHAQPPASSGARVGRSVEPELYPRPDGTVYACGEPQSDVPVPPGGAAEVTVDAARADSIVAAAASLASCLKGRQQQHQQQQQQHQQQQPVPCFQATKPAGDSS